MPSKEFDSGEIDRIALEVKRRLLSGELDADLQSLATDEATINQLAAVVGKTTDQSISANTTTKIDWDQEATDDRGEFDLSNNKFSPSVAGDYRIDVGFLFTANSDQDRLRVEIRKSGSLYRQASKAASGTDNQGCNHSFYLHDLTTGDTVEITVLCPDGSNNITGAAVWSYASFVRVG